MVPKERVPSVKGPNEIGPNERGPIVIGPNLRAQTSWAQTFLVPKVMQAKIAPPGTVRVKGLIKAKEKGKILPGNSF